MSYAHGVGYKTIRLLSFNYYNYNVCIINLIINILTSLISIKLDKCLKICGILCLPGVQRAGTGGVRSRSLTQLQSMLPLHLYMHTHIHTDTF